MTSIDELIKREVNPFDLINTKVGNFWGESQDSTQTVESIHQEAINEIDDLLNLVANDYRTRTALLVGDSGSGKSYLLGRLKRTLNSKAFFTYISPWADNDYAWRHVLRQTVDSLIQIPEGQQESQLILWLKGLSAFTKRSLKQRIFNDNFWQVLYSDRKKFITHLKNTYKKEGIYNSEIFFGVLHDLIDPELYPLACEWLRGDNLSEESMQALHVKQCIDSEDAAKNILENFGKIATDTQPIVLCFDQVETLPNWSLNPQVLFNINTTFHNDNLKGFLIIISVVKDPWNQIVKRIAQSDKARIERQVNLKPISLDQAEALWRYYLKPLHNRADNLPKSPIFPLSRQILEQNFPGGKTHARTSINLGSIKYREYKLSLPSIVAGLSGATKKGGGESITTGKITEKERFYAEFKLIWQKEYRKTQTKIAKISLLGATDLIQMLMFALDALQIQGIKPKLLTGTYASYSLSYQAPGKRERIGIIWTEDSNMNSFFNIMNACQKVVHNNLCSSLYLIRISSVGNSKLVGNKLYQQIFQNSKNIHIKPSLGAVQLLATYRSLVNSAQSQELVVGGKTISYSELKTLVSETSILHDCTLLQNLNLLPQQKVDVDFKPAKDFLLNVVKTQSFMGVPTLIKQASEQFSPEINDVKIEQLIKELIQENQVKIFNPKDKIQEQLICLVA
ncbi:MAG: ATP-binding protein [Scytonematopsis contorta HA4267-MV1]|jgi:hypothetical protein|nr:ATP-binding protein [Scytonematopsis contorta HA4267-MV1]